MRKKVLFPILAVVLALSLALPMAAVVGAASGSETISSDTNTKVYYAGLDDNTYPVSPSSSISIPAGWNSNPSFDDTSWTNAFFYKHSAYFTPNSAPYTTAFATGTQWISIAASGQGLDYSNSNGQRGVYLFRTTFDLPSGFTITSAKSGIGSDNYGWLYLNGNTVLSPGDLTQNDRNFLYPTDGPGPSTTTSINPSWFVAGTNVVAVEVQNGVSIDGNGPIGVVFSLEVAYTYNNPPVANDDSYTTDEDTVLNVSAPGVLTNDTDPESDPLTVTAVDTTATQGQVTAWSADGSFTYDPDDQFDGLAYGETDADTFTYTVSDGSLTDTATVTITIEGNNDPGIDVEKETDEEAYFNGTEVTYHITVTNTGDCELTIDVTDDKLGTIAEGDTLTEGSPITYNVPYILECPPDNYEYSLHSNIVTAVGEDSTAGIVSDCDCWTVIIFQWQPRSKGFWGNWDNHWEPEEMFNIVRYVNAQSDYFDYGNLTVDNVDDILLAADQRGKMDEDKAEALLKKQLLAAWLNVKSYEGWTDSLALSYGSPDASMDPNALVYFETGGSMTVEALLHRIEYNLNDGMGIKGMLQAKDILDMMNNAESNNYEMFVHPDFDPEVCLLTGDWLLDVNGGVYMHDMFIVSQDSSGALTGTGGYPASGPPYNSGYDWTLTGQLTGNSVTLVITYTNTYTTTLTGTVGDCGMVMSGTGTSGVVTWVATRLP